MEDLDKRMQCMGFNQESVNDYAEAIPFNSRKSDIMIRIKKVSLVTPWISDFYALFYILSIAFSVLVLRFFVFAEADNTLLVSLFTGVVINYSDLLLDGFRLISLVVSVFICTGIYFLIHHLKNDRTFC